MNFKEIILTIFVAGVAIYIAALIFVPETDAGTKFEPRPPYNFTFIDENNQTHHVVVTFVNSPDIFNEMDKEAQFYDYDFDSDDNDYDVIELPAGQPGGGRGPRRDSPRMPRPPPAVCPNSMFIRKHLCNWCTNLEDALAFSERRVDEISYVQVII